MPQVRLSSRVAVRAIEGHSPVAGRTGFLRLRKRCSARRWIQNPTCLEAAGSERKYRGE